MSKTIKIDDLRICKLYSILKVERDKTGYIDNVETVKAVPFYVVAIKHKNKFKIVPTSKSKIKATVYDIAHHSETEHDLVVNKTHSNNKYRKPFHLCRALEGKELLESEVLAFAEQVSNISASLPQEESEKKLTAVCENLNKQLEGTLAQSETEDLVD